MKSGNACYHSVQNLLSSSLLSENWRINVYRTIILPVVFYGCETWSLTMRKECMLRLLRRIFGPKRDEVTGEWRKLHNEELNYLYSTLNIVRLIKSRKMRWAGHELVWQLGRPRRKWGDNIKMDLQEVGCGGMDWIELAEDRDRWRALVNTVMNLQVP